MCGKAEKMKLTKEFLEKQEGILLKEKTRIESEIKKLKEYPDYGNDNEDTLQEISDYENNISINDEIQTVLKKVKKSLKSIETGNYGQCTSCKGDIEIGRLKIMPSAQLCVTCESKESK